MSVIVDQQFEKETGTFFTSSRIREMKFESFSHCLPPAIPSSRRTKCSRRPRPTSTIKHRHRVCRNERCISVVIIAFIDADECALVTAAKDIGVVFFRRTPDSVFISFVRTSCSSRLADPLDMRVVARRRRTVRSFERSRIQQVSFIAPLPFCITYRSVRSDRKRMSVILRTPRNEIKLYCKGAVRAIHRTLSIRTGRFV